MASEIMSVDCIPCLSDNYVWLVHEPSTNTTAVIDPSEATPVISALESRGWQLNYVLNTHHHMDHTGGNLELKQKYGAKIVGPAADQARIPGIDQAVRDGDVFKLGAVEFHVFDTPGHTRGHITYWAPGAEALFPGDTLFCLGCGRLFEGTPQQMWSSLSKLVQLPPNTRVYCAHEYTQSNARFAVTVDPQNAALVQRKAEIDAARAKGQRTVPSLLADELATNPFLRPHDPALRRHMGQALDAPDWEVFAAVRAAKDRF